MPAALKGPRARMPLPSWFNPPPPIGGCGPQVWIGERIGFFFDRPPSREGWQRGLPMLVMARAELILVHVRGQGPVFTMTKSRHFQHMCDGALDHYGLRFLFPRAKVAMNPGAGNLVLSRSEFRALRSWAVNPPPIARS